MGWKNSEGGGKTFQGSFRYCTGREREREGGGGREGGREGGRSESGGRKEGTLGVNSMLYVVKACSHFYSPLPYRKSALAPF
jgi:hypothetical protein